MPNILRYPVAAWRRNVTALEFQSSLVLTSLSMGFLRNITVEDLKEASSVIREAASRVHVRLDEVKNIRTGSFEYYWVSALTTNRVRSVSPATYEYASLQQAVFIAEVFEMTLNGVRVLDLMSTSNAVWDAASQQTITLTTDQTLNFTNGGSIAQITTAYEKFLNGAKSPRVLLDAAFVQNYCTPLIDSVLSIQGLSQTASYSAPATLILLSLAENLNNVRGYLFGWGSRGVVVNTSRYQLPSRLSPSNFISVTMRLLESEARQRTTEGIVKKLQDIDTASFLNTANGLQLSDSIPLDVWDKITNATIETYVEEAHYLHSVKLALAHFEDWAIAALFKACKSRMATLPDALTFAVSVLSNTNGLTRTKTPEEIDHEYSTLNDRYGATISDVVIPTVKRWYSRLSASDVFNFAIRKITSDGRELINFVQQYSWTDKRYKLCAFTSGPNSSVLTIRRCDVTPVEGDNLPPFQKEWQYEVPSPKPTNAGTTSTGLVYDIPNLTQIRQDLRSLGAYIECTYDPELNTLVVNNKQYIGTIKPPRFGKDVPSTGATISTRRTTGTAQYSITPIDPLQADVDDLLFAVSSPAALAASDEQRAKMYAERLERLGQTCFVEKEISYGPLTSIELFSPATFAVLSKIYCNPDAITSRRKFFILPSGVTTQAMKNNRLCRSALLPREVDLQFFLPHYALTDAGVQLLSQQSKIEGTLNPRLGLPSYEIAYSANKADEPFGYNELADPIEFAESRVALTLRISVDDEVDCFGQAKIPMAPKGVGALAPCFKEVSGKRLLTRLTYSQSPIALAFNEKHDVVSVFDSSGPVNPADLFVRGAILQDTIAKTLLANLAALTKDAYIILSQAGGKRDNYLTGFGDIKVLKDELSAFKKVFEEKVCVLSTPGLTLQQIDASMPPIALATFEKSLSNLNAKLNPLSGDLKDVAAKDAKDLGLALMDTYNCASAFNTLRLGTLNVAVPTPIDGRRRIMERVGCYHPVLFEAPKVVSAVTLPEIVYIDPSFMSFMANTVKEILNFNFAR